MCPNSVRSGASLALALLALLAAPARSARAADSTVVRPELETEQQWNSNIFSQRHYGEDSLVTLVRPGLSIINTGDRGFVRARGWLSHHAYWQESELTGTDRGGALDGNFRLTPRLTLTGNGSLARYQNQDTIRDEDVVERDILGEVEAIVPGQVVTGGVPDIDIRQGYGGLRYQLTPRTELSLNGGPFVVDYTKQHIGAANERDRNGYFADAMLAHELDLLDTIYLRFGYNLTDQDNATAGVVPVTTQVFAPPTDVFVDTGTSRSDIESLEVGWQRNWSPLWFTKASIGVRRLHSQIDDLSTRASTFVYFGNIPAGATGTFVPTDFDDTGTGLIGEIIVRRAFARSLVQLTLSRETRANSGATTPDVNVDSLTADWTRQLTPRVALHLRGRFEYQESASDAPVLVGADYAPELGHGVDWACPSGSKLIVLGGAGDTAQCEIGTSSNRDGQRVLLSARLDWQLRKRLATFLNVRYYDQAGDPGLFGGNYDKYLIGVGFRYAWDLEL